MRRSFLAAIVAVGLLEVGRAEAQTCLASPSFSVGRVRLSGGADFGNDARGFGIGLSLGSATAFGGFGVSGTSYDNVAGSTFGIGAHAGYQVPLGTGGRVQLCPFVGGGLGFGPNNIEGTGVDMSSQGADVGLYLGASLLQSPTFDVVPSVGFSLVYGKVTFRADDGSSISDSETYGSASIGVGLVINRILNLLPHVAVPFGLQGADPTVGVTLALNLGPRF